MAERDRYGANDIKPGLTGLAQINGRDELEIPVKAKFDGEYVKALKKGMTSGFLMDPKPFYTSAHCVVLPSYHEGIHLLLCHYIIKKFMWKMR